MAVNKNESQQQIKYSTDISADYRIVVITPTTDATVPYGDLSGVNPNNGLLYKIYQDLQATYTDETISAESDSYILLGLAATYRYVVIEYTAERGSLYRGGKIEVLNDGTNGIANDSYVNSDESNYDWLTCALSTVNSSQLRIKLTTDDTDANDTTFRYRISEKIEKV